jgi:hypothetical protein
MKSAGLVTAVLAFVMAATAGAEPWSPDLRRPKLFGGEVENLDIAIDNVCLPYILDGAAESTWRKNGIIPRDPPPPSFQRFSTYWIGRYVTVGVGMDGADRTCQIMAERGDPQALRAALQARLDQLPYALTPAAYQYARNDYSAREFLCAPPDGPHDAVLISTGHTAKGGASLMVTFFRGEKRSARCDGTPPDAGTATLLSPSTALQQRFEAATRFCRALVAGSDPEKAASESAVSFGAVVALRDSPFAKPEGNEIATFLGAEARIRIAVERPGQGTLLVASTESGDRCHVRTAGAVDLSAARSWIQDATVETATERDASVTKVYFRRTQ